ncbi:MAG TPA: lysophospholipid acyltransferase family protein, partial [Gemmatimonadales bacterium]|nr:lysophospholipid acyltransferase family protein [Gemmatimonadales bacterium]
AVTGPPGMMPVPQSPVAGSEPVPGCPRRGGPLTQWLGRTLLRLGGWRVEGRLPDEPRFVLIVAPHTSNWDFILGLLAMFTIGIRLSWLGKHSIFRFPIVGLLRWLGGEPVDRRVHHGIVEAAIDRFRSRRQWVLGIAPEGTRKRVEQWKTGFYLIAVGADVPILPVAFDYSRRVVDLGTLFRPTGDQEADIPAIRARYRKEMARHPENFVEPEGRSTAPGG